MDLEISLNQGDIQAQRLQGRVKFRARVAAPSGPAGSPRDIRTVQLDASGLDIRAVEMSSGAGASTADRPTPLRYSAAGSALVIDLGRRYRPGEEFTLQIDYATDPKPETLYFLSPDDDHPHRPTMIYTMSEPLKARGWLPCHDWPDTRWTCDIAIRVPEPLSAVSIGEPAGEPVSNGDGTRTFHWRQTTPIDPHLIGLAIGEFATLRVGEWRGRPIRAYVQPGYEDAAHYTFRRVPEIIDFYAGLLGVDFPYPCFAHATVVEHFHGGMEHAGFSMIAPTMLTTGPRGDVPEDWPQYNYIAHMLGHAWFGGLVNYRDVHDAWLNEGFATYLHHLWWTRTEGPDAFDDQMADAARQLAERDVAGRDHPVVRAELPSADEVYTFDHGKVYYKGMWVLHMLRHELGDTTFWEGARRFLTTHAHGCASTADLRSAFEGAAQRDLGPYFDQWVYRDGLPRLALKYEWEEATRQARITVAQRQKIDEQHPAMRFPLEVWFRTGGSWERRRFEITQAEQTEPVPLATEPDMVCADPLGTLLAARKEEKPEGMWHRQVREGPTPPARRAAIEHLRAMRDEPAVPVLRDALLDPAESARVRRHAAAALAAIRNDAAFSGVMEAATQSPADVGLRAAIVRALAAWRYRPEAYRAVLGFAGVDRPIEVQAEAMRALGEFDRNFFAAEVIESLAGATLPPMSRHVRSAAMAALGRILDPRALKILLADSAPKVDDPLELRRELIELSAAIAARHLPQRRGAADFLFAQLEDDRPSIRAAALRGLAAVGSEADLTRLRARPHDGKEDVRKAASEAMEAIERRVNSEPP